MKIRVVLTNGWKDCNRVTFDGHIEADSPTSAIPQQYHNPGYDVGPGFAYLCLPQGDCYLVSEDHPEFYRGL